MRKGVTKEGMDKKASKKAKVWERVATRKERKRMG